ncbi:flagellar basal body-associated FliL family protein [Kribbella jiaozuonensis]|uniref:hypothetical protein n=1 Tax=Kribbella jiaozuonensis TaxID=2575441 RepID=UPI00192D29F6|nr:hypothetical protein [Kribbella jiaozuonensis]
MSQQYGPPPGPPPAPAPAPGGWGTAPQARPGGPAPGGWGPGPQRPHQPPKSNRTAWIIMAGAIVAVLLVATGVVLLVNGSGKDKPVSQQTPDPVGTLYTPSPTPTPNDSKGSNDAGVEVGWGIWFIPSKGWLKSPDKTYAGQNWILQQFSARGLIDGYYWVRQTELYNAKGFAEHLVDIESNSMQGVRIGSGVACTPANPNIKACYALSYTGVWVGKTGAKIAMKGFVTAYQDQFGRVTATDAALESRVYQRRVNELIYMNNSVVKSF